jgi:predicted DNA-binding ribbon-helix-helix protein
VKPMKRSVYFDGLNSSVWLEDPFWTALKEIAASEKKSVSELVQSVDARRTTVNRSSAMRVFVLEYYEDRLRTHEAADTPTAVTVLPSH